jgi:hypothetical protein
VLALMLLLPSAALLSLQSLSAVRFFGGSPLSLLLLLLLVLLLQR